MKILRTLEEKLQTAEQRGAEELDGRAFALRMGRKAWIIPAGAVLGAVLAGLLYLLVTTLAAPARTYEATAKLYIDFAYDETGTVYDYYNGATWTDLLTAHPGISEPMEALLPAGRSLADVKTEVKAEILTDIRLMTVTVKDAEAETAADIRDAVCGGLVSFGETAKEFTAITVLSVTEPTLIVYSYRTRNAVLAGLFLGFLVSLFGLLFYEAASDEIAVPEEAERRFGLPVAAVIAKDGTSLRGSREGILTAPLSAVQYPTEPYALEVPMFTRGAGARLERDIRRAAREGKTVTGLVLVGADKKFLEKYYGEKL